MTMNYFKLNEDRFQRTADRISEMCISFNEHRIHEEHSPYVLEIIKRCFSDCDKAITSIGIHCVSADNTPCIAHIENNGCFHLIKQDEYDDWIFQKYGCVD